jgi:hypothetical protein
MKVSRLTDHELSDLYHRLDAGQLRVADIHRMRRHIEALTEQRIVTNIPCPDSNTIAGDCPGHLVGQWHGSELRFACGECGRIGGHGSTC